MWVGSHKDELKHHSENFDEGNLLTRGQTVENVPNDQIKPIELNAGQMSLHHPKTVHGSGLNKSNDRRIGFVIQSYIGTNVKQVIGKNGVQLARGEDKFNFHQHINRPSSLMNKDDNQQRIIENQNLREGIKVFSDWPTIPQLYVKNEFIGGCDIVKEMYESGELAKLFESKNINFKAKG